MKTLILSIMASSRDGGNDKPEQLGYRHRPPVDRWGKGRLSEAVYFEIYSVRPYSRCRRRCHRLLGGKLAHTRQAASASRHPVGLQA